jgi:putative hydrolase of the HAD superfamily
VTFRAIVFDLDDTLYAEHSFTLSGFRVVAQWASERFGVPATDCYAGLCDLFDAGHHGDTFDQWLSSRGLDANGTVEEMVEVFRDHRPEITLDESVVGLLKRLRERFRLGILTDGYAGVQRRKATALGVVDLVDVVVYSDDLGRDFWKPHVRPFETMLEGLRVTGPEAVYVADNPAKDFFGARAAGLATVRVRRRNGVYAAVEPRSPEWAADEEIDDVLELENALNGPALVDGMKG